MKMGFYSEETYKKVLAALDDHRITIQDNDLRDAEFHIGNVILPIPESIDAYTFIQFYTRHTIAVRISEYLDDHIMGLKALDQDEYDEVMAVLDGKDDYER